MSRCLFILPPGEKDYKESIIPRITHPFRFSEHAMLQACRLFSFPSPFFLFFLCLLNSFLLVLYFLSPFIFLLLLSNSKWLLLSYFDLRFSSFLFCKFIFLSFSSCYSLLLLDFLFLQSNPLSVRSHGSAFLSLSSVFFSTSIFLFHASRPLLVFILILLFISFPRSSSSSSSAASLTSSLSSYFKLFSSSSG